MTGLDLLHVLHSHPTLTFLRVGEALKVLPAVPEEARPVLAHFKPAIVQALEDGERLDASRLLTPWRLGALLAHVLGVEGPLVLTLYATEGESRPYLVPPKNLTPHLAWASQSLPPPRRLHLAARSGAWALDLREGWKVGVEARAGRTRYLLLLPRLEARTWFEGAHKGLVHPGELVLWLPPAPPEALGSWSEAPPRLEVVAHA